MRRLTAFPVYAALPDEEVAVLATIMQESEVDAGADVVVHGDFGYAMYGIEEGEADVLLDGETAVAPLGAGDTFGEIGLLVTGKRTASVVTRTPMRLIWLFDQDFQRIRPQVPEFERALRRLAGERLSG